MINDNYPLGAANDPNAPFNRVDPEPIEVEVTVSITLSKTVKIYVDDYIQEASEVDEDGHCYQGGIDFSECNLCQAVEEQITLPNEKVEGWNVDDFEVNLEYMVDNFDLIRPMFYFNEANNMFFHCQIVQRAKDHKPNKVKEGAIKTYFIRSTEHFDRIKDEIILLCEHYGARAYINVAGKDFEAMQKLMLMNLARNVTENIVQNPRKILNSAAGELKSRNNKWIIDIDDKSLLDSVLQWLYDYFKVDKKLYLKATIPTVQGVHLIVIPFNLQLFHSTFPDIDVHKNSMGTLLYYPKSLDK